MKILHTSDNHVDFFAKRLGSIKYDNGQNIYYKQRLDLTTSIINDGVDKKVDVIVVSGDFHNKIKPPPQELADTYKIFDSVPSNIPVIIISGNHDESTSRGSPLLPLLHRRNNIHVALTLTYTCIFGVNFLLAPWNTPFSDIQKFCSKEAPDVLVYHVGVHTDSSHWGEIEGENGTVTVEQLKSLNLKAILLGHFHGQTEFTPNIWYAGSPEYFNFGEEHQEKGYLFWDVGVSVTPIKTQTTKFRTFTIEEFMDTNEINVDCIKIQGEGTQIDKARVISKLEELECSAYKIDIDNPIKSRRLFTLQGNTNTMLLKDYLQNKQIDPVDKLLELDASISKCIYDAEST